MAKGGKTNQQMKTMGRNLAKVANQKKSVMKVRKDMGKVVRTDTGKVARNG